MKWLGSIKDPKDLTTKEYVDDADTLLAKSLAELEENKISSSDIQNFTDDEIQRLWNTHIT